MKKRGTRALALWLSMALLLAAPAHAAGNELEQSAERTAAYLAKTVSAPTIAQVGGEWTVLGLARGEFAVPAGYFAAYTQRVEAAVAKAKGVLHSRKYTEYARVALALTALGQDPRSVGGYDLLLPLADYEGTLRQGINGAIWALLALDSAHYPVPTVETGKTQATRQRYVDKLLDAQLPGGGWTLGGSQADADLTGMALQALAKYREQSAVARAVEQALGAMSRQQLSSGGFSAWGGENVEGLVQMLVALCELGLPVDDARFVKNGTTMVERLLEFQLPDGGFRHGTDGTDVDLMATEQANYALSALLRQQAGKSTLYDMAPTVDWGLPGKVAAIGRLRVISPGKTFADIAHHADRAAMETLAARGVLHGATAATFDPDATMTRAAFAAVVVRALGLTATGENPFTDVAAGTWAADAVRTANAYGIVRGKTATQFGPKEPITRQAAAVMVVRAAILCGLDPQMTEKEATLTGYTDVSGAQAALAFCVRAGWMDDTAGALRPQEPILRCEVARMVAGLLEQGKLL